MSSTARGTGTEGVTEGRDREAGPNGVMGKRYQHPGPGLRLAVAVAGGCVIVLAAAAGSETLDPAALSAGVFTIAESGPAAFSVPVAMLDGEQSQVFAKGKEQ